MVASNMSNNRRLCASANGARLMYGQGHEDSQISLQINKDGVHT